MTKRTNRVTRKVPTLSLVAQVAKASCLGFGLLPLVGHAGVIQVNAGNDSTGNNDECTLREAITTINQNDLNAADCFGDLTGDDTITFANSLAGSTIVMSGSPLYITQDVTIDASAVGGVTLDWSEGIGGLRGEDIALSLKQLTITRASGNAVDVNATNFFSPITLSIENCTITENTGRGIRVRNGHLSVVDSEVSYNESHGIEQTGRSLVIDGSTIKSNSTGENYGAGLRIADFYSVQISDSFILDNMLTHNPPASNFQGAGLAIFGGVFSGSSFDSYDVDISNTLISGNRVDDNNSGSRAGGGIFARDNVKLSILNSSITNNYARNGGGIYAFAGAEVAITGSTVSSNSAKLYGGGVFVRSHETRISNPPAGTPIASLTITNSTVSGNTAQDVGGGGIYLGIIAEATLKHATLSENYSKAQGAGLTIHNGTLVATNSIIANSTGSVDCFSNFQPMLPSDYFFANDTLVESGTSCYGASFLDPLIGPLMDNGGPTLTHALLEGSPAVGIGNTVSCEAQDQRGELRGEVCDAGAFELGVQPPETGGFFVIPISDGKAVVVPE